MRAKLAIHLTLMCQHFSGQTQAAAEGAITEAGLSVGTTFTQSSATVPSGSVISQSPASGSEASAGSSVNLVISSGVAPVAGEAKQVPTLSFWGLLALSGLLSVFGTKKKKTL